MYGTAFLCARCHRGSPSSNVPTTHPRVEHTHHACWEASRAAGVVQVVQVELEVRAAQGCASKQQWHMCELVLSAAAAAALAHPAPAPACNPVSKGFQQLHLAVG